MNNFQSTLPSFLSSWGKVAITATVPHAWNSTVSSAHTKCRNDFIIMVVMWSNFAFIYRCQLLTMMSYNLLELLDTNVYLGFHVYVCRLYYFGQYRIILWSDSIFASIKQLNMLTAFAWLVPKNTVYSNFHLLHQWMVLVHNTLQHPYTHNSLCWQIWYSFMKTHCEKLFDFQI